jgi:hypothetical protein
MGLWAACEYQVDNRQLWPESDFVSSATSLAASAFIKSIDDDGLRRLLTALQHMQWVDDELSLLIATRFIRQEEVLVVLDCKHHIFSNARESECQSVCYGRDNQGDTLCMLVRKEESRGKPACSFQLLSYGECNGRFSDTSEAIEPNVRPIVLVEEFSQSSSKGNTCIYHAF